MFGRVLRKHEPKLEVITDRLLDDMIVYGPDAEEYSSDLEYLKTVTALRATSRRSLDPNTVAIVVGNLVGILIIVAVEQKHVLTSKGFSFILKPK